ncbi:hypothetical protein [Pedobacter boryungensis]|uniref:DUF4397 domain-containing protein n=1 Tax=Pedobacter boryungensis TaxID=869962 RepID=A0ABX2DFY0_9SPHI|nr:hypothetical protein [Pedobacter boryungensis]NQX32875.1 hypothetical protein [Pedobacter boryungensis]
MKKNILLFPIYLLALAMMFASCEKNAVVDITTPYSGAQFKYYNFAINGPTVNFYANDVKTTATLTASGVEAATGVNFGGLVPLRGYSLSPVGSVKFSSLTPSTMVVNAALGQGPNIETSAVTKTVEDGKNYSYYTSGIYDYVTKKSDAFIIEDILPAPDTSIAYIRLVNPGHNTTALSLELTQTFTSTTPGVPPLVIVTTPITGIVYKTASPYIAVKQGAYSLRLIDSPSGKLVTRTATSFLKGRLYTFTLRGNLITNSPAPFLDFTENR